jgi:hypothetical protein
MPPANHRSLLVVNRKIKIGFHYDSLNHRNEDAAKETLGKIGLLLNERKFSISFQNAYTKISIT